jgi:hypothetical protein
MRILNNPITRQELIASAQEFIDENTIKAVVDINQKQVVSKWIK